MNTHNFPIEKLLVYITFFFLTCCNPNSASSQPLNEYSEKYSTLDSVSMKRLEEINSWKIMDAPISLIKYNNLSNSLIAVNEENKEIVNLDIETGETKRHKILNVTSFRILGIDGKSEKLLGAMLSTRPNLRGELTKYLDWFAIWDTNSGFQVECIRGLCNGIDEYEHSEIGSTADLNAEIFVFFSEFSYSTRTNESSSIDLVNSPDADYWWHIGNIAIDSYNNRLAIVYQEGRITLENIRHSNWPFSFTTVLAKGNENQLESVHAALFDRSGKWLAIVRGDQLSIWDTDGWVKKMIYLEDVSAFHGMSFSPSSKFLFLGTDEKIKIINLDENKLELELNTPGITCLDVSEDNRLLFWGDENGTVNLWGIPQNH